MFLREALENMTTDERRKLVRELLALQCTGDETRNAALRGLALQVDEDETRRLAR